MLRYKQKRQIINRAYQQTADDIVGIMTITRLDQDLARLPVPPPPPVPPPQPVPPLPVPPSEPLGRAFSIRCGAAPDVFELTEPADGDPLRRLIPGGPFIFQVVDLTNQRRALYMLGGRFDRPPAVSPSRYVRSPRVFPVPRGLPLSGLGCDGEFFTRVSHVAPNHLSHLELSLPTGRIQIPMFLHIDQPFPTGTPAITVGLPGAFTFVQFGFNLGTPEA